MTATVFAPWNAKAQFTNPDGSLTVQANRFLLSVFGNANGNNTVGAVTGLTAVGVEHGIKVSATLPNELDLAFVELWRSNDNILAHAVLLTKGLASSYTDTPLEASDGTKYYWARCVNTTNTQGVFVGPVSAVAGLTSTPGSVTGLTATSIIGGINISGTLPTDPDLATVELWWGTTNVLASATFLTSGLTSSYNKTSGITQGTTYYFWTRCINTSGAQGAFVGPVSAVAGKVQSGDIASGAVQVAAFASGIEPVTIVSLVPSVKSTNSIFNTADGKLYRWNGSAYTKLVTAGDIDANAVTAGTIAAGAVSAAQISVSQLSAITANLGTVTAGNINGTANISITGSAQFEGALSSGGNTWAVVANSSGGSFGGVRGLATTGFGVQGSAAGTNGVGVYGSASGTGGAGVVAAATGGATALNVSGPTVINNSSLTWNGYSYAAPTGGTTTFLRNDGTWAVPPGTGGGGVTSVSATSSVGGLTLSSSGGTTPTITLSGNSIAKALVYQTTVTPSSTAIAGYIKVLSQDGTVGPVAIPYCNLP